LGMAVGPGPVGPLVGQKIGADALVPVTPVLAADLVHGMGGIVVSVPEVMVVGEMILQEIDGLGNFPGLVFAAELQDADACGRACEAGRVGGVLIAEAAAAGMVQAL